MDLKYLIKEEIENYISELVPDNAATPFQQKIKNLSKEDIALIPKANNRRYEISFKDPEINAQFKADSEIANPSIMIDPTNYNYILTVEPIPQSFRNLGLGKKIYEKLSDQLGYISSSDKDKTTDTDRSVDATRVWDSLKRVSSNYFIEFPNRTIFLVSPEIQDQQEDQILDYFTKTKTDINSVATNLPPNWKKGLELALNRTRRPVPSLVAEMIEDSFDSLIKEEFNRLMEVDDPINLDQSNLNKILQGYLEAALWTEEDNLKSQIGDDELGDNDQEEDESESEIDKLIRLTAEFQRKPFMSFIVDNIDPDSKIQAYMDIKAFMDFAGKDAIMEAIQEKGLERLGHDIWLTRNHHGAGFFDHSYEHEKLLMDAAHKLKSVDMYITDDNRIVFSNA